MLSILESIGLLIISLISYILYIKLIYPFYLGPLRHLPRKPNGILHCFQYTYKIITGHPPTYLELHQLYGPVVHAESDMVSLNDPNCRKHFLTYKFKKDYSYTLLNINGPNLFSTPDKLEHQKLKKLLSPAFNNKSLNLMELTIFKVGSVNLINFINSSLRDNNTEFDLFHLFHCNTLDVISELIFGKSLNTTWDIKKAKYYIKELAKTQFMIFLRLIVPFYNRVKYPMEVLFKPLILKEIKTRRDNLSACNNNSNNDILQSMIEAKDPDSGDCMTDLEIVDECLVLLFAGMDTTANTMTWTMYEILKNPDVYKLITNEVLATFPNLEEPISVERAKIELKYLEAAILESMRLHPVVTGPLTRVVPEGGLIVEGHYLPPETVIALDVYTQHNDPSFWQNPREFNIRRWLGPARDQNKSKLIPFGIGPRSCIGRDLALNEIYLVITNLIRNFEFDLIDRDLTPIMKFLYKPKEMKFRVKVSKRVI